MRLAQAPPNPWFSWEYVERNAQDIARYLEQHASLTFQAVVIAFVLALPLGALAHLRPRLAGPVLGVAGVLYTVPSLALFAILAPLHGHRPDHRAHRARVLRAARADAERAGRAAGGGPGGARRRAWHGLRPGARCCSRSSCRRRCPASSPGSGWPR